MATKPEPKTDRKKIVSTQVVGTVTVFHRTDTGIEIGRIDRATMTPDMQAAVGNYGIKQIVSDTNSQLEGEAKINGIKAAIASLGAGAWPRRASAPIVVTLDMALDVTLKTMQVSNPTATMADVRRMLGLDGGS